MRKIVLFISESEIKESSIIEDNTNPKLIRITLNDVQELQLRPLLGDTLYNEIREAIISKSQDSSFVIPDNIQEVLDECKDFLVYGTLMSIPPVLNIKGTNKGLVVKTDTSAETLDIFSEYGSIVNYYKVRFDSYRERLIKYLGLSCQIDFNGSNLGNSTGWFLPGEGLYKEIKDRKINKY